MKDTELAAFIKNHRGVTPASLASHLGVSERTVRTYIRRLNDAMQPFARVSLKYGGYQLACDNKRAFAEWLSEGKAKWASVSGGLPTNARERVAYITDDLLSRSDWITKDELAEALYVSSNTISHDLVQVEKSLSSFGLSLERRPHHGIRVMGDEMGRRLCMASVVADRLFEGHDDEQGGKRYLLERVSSCVDEVLRRDSFSISTLAQRNLLVHLLVALQRIKEGCYVPTDKHEIDGMEGTREFAVACDIAQELEIAFDVALPPEEIAYIAIHLASKQMRPPEDEGSNIVIGDDVWRVVSDMLELVNQIFYFDFRNNLELRMNLARHIVPLSYRLKYNMTLKNPLLDEVRERYPLAWSMAVESSATLIDAYGRVPSDDEVGYIAMSFALALERDRTHADGKSILIVCASGVGTAKLLEHLYEREFGQWLSNIMTCDQAHVMDVDFSTIDYVFTTVPLEGHLPVPVREVNAFLDETEIRDVRGILSGSAVWDTIISRFDKELFFPNVRGETREEVLDWLCDRRIEYGGAGEQYRSLVFRREETASTTYGNNVAMPHPLEAKSEKTLVTVGILDRPVKWGPDHDVSVVFLLSVSPDDSPDRHFYDVLANLFIDPAAIERLRRERRWETLVALLGSSGRM